MLLMRLLFALLLNAIPLYGVAFRGWSAGAVVVLYWFETLMTFVFTSARIALHRKLTRKRGHWRIPMLRDHLQTLFVVLPGLGIFVVGFVAMTHSFDDTSIGQIRQGAIWMSIAMMVEFLLDAAWLRTRSFGWIRAYTERRGGGVLVMFLLILFGMLALDLTKSPLAVVYVMIVLKTLWNLFEGTALANAGGLMTQPPAWALTVANLLKKSSGGAEKFAQRWTRDHEKAIDAAKHDEEVMPAEGAIGAKS
jgi:hypothetical protein